jgi:two-component sensor histidine kinase
LIVQEKVIGVMTMASDRPGCFDPTAVRLAELWGQLAAVTIANERVYEQMGQAIEARDRLLRQRDAIFNLNATITRLRSTDAILHAIVEQAAEPLGVDLCQVVLLDEKTDEMVVAATTPPYDRGLNGFRFNRRGTNSNEALTRQKLMVIEDGFGDPKSQQFLKTVLPCGSIMHVPLFTTGGKPIGVLVLLREKRGGFSAEQQNLAQLFGARAAVAIENAELYQQTLQGAQTQTMLLRELSHRVKNSLSGIVALLSIDRPAMSPQAKQWLSRVVDRIRTLARTHEMFTEGKPGGSLRELFDQTLKSLSVVTQSGVTVRTELIGGDKLLRPDRAVSVAMLLHELCYNALVHGLGGAGKLLVRSSTQPEQRLLIEVIDDGRGFVEGEPDDLMLWEDSKPRAAVMGSTHTGLGLNLVRDFVARELQGQFSIESVPGQGTTARVTFKLLDEEIGNA